ncbi:hypothetical protein S245_065639 [Arachis hypogaea]
MFFCVNNCKSVETVSSLISKPPRKDKAFISFHNFPKLDDHAYEIILRDLKSSIEIIANNDGYPNNEEKNDNISFYHLPSKESILNNWFLTTTLQKLRSLLKFLQIRSFLLALLSACYCSQYQYSNHWNKHMIFGCECNMEKGCNK